MYTDFYLTNLSTVEMYRNVVFFQKTTTNTHPAIRSFKNVENCQYKWSHKVRVYWDLNFRLVYASGGTTSAYPLKTVYTRQSKFFLISKEGIISVQQSYRNGKQIIDFEQIKNDGFIAIQVYRGNYLVELQYFKGKYLNSQIDTIINITQCYKRELSEGLSIKDLKDTLNIDFTTLKSVFLSLEGDKGSTRKLHIDNTVKW